MFLGHKKEILRSFENSRTFEIIYRTLDFIPVTIGQRLFHLECIYMNALCVFNSD